MVAVSCGHLDKASGTVLYFSFLYSLKWIPVAVGPTRWDMHYMSGHQRPITVLNYLWTQWKITIPSSISIIAGPITQHNSYVLLYSGFSSIHQEILFVPQSSSAHVTNISVNHKGQVLKFTCSWMGGATRPVSRTSKAVQHSCVHFNLLLWVLMYSVIQPVMRNWGQTGATIWPRRGKFEMSWWCNWEFNHFLCFI